MKYFGWTLKEWAFAKTWYLLQTGKCSVSPDCAGAWEIQRHWFYVAPKPEVAPHAGYNFTTGYVLVVADYLWAASMIASVLQDY